MYIKCMCRMGGSQRLPRIMRAWERTRNIILKVNCNAKKFFAHMKAYWS